MLRLLAKNAAQIASRVGVPVEVRRVLVRDREKPRAVNLPEGTLTTDPEAILGDDAIDVVVEVIGGDEPASTWVTRALESGRCVVTANKALLAKRGPDLLELAQRQGVALAFEAAVGGGIPVIRTLRDATASDEVVELCGILNGTSNFMLTRMVDDGASFADALREAQEKGYAEADPSLDIDGHDAAQKLSILAMLAFGARPPHKGMIVEGIRGLDAFDVKMAERFGYSIKHLAIGRDRDGLVELRAHPTLVKRSSVWSNVSGVLNGVRLEGRALGPCLLSGRGAGDMPTAVSVVSDVVDVARSIVAGVPGFVTGTRALKARPLLPAEDIVLRYYLRLTVSDQPGVMAKVAGALADEKVSLWQILQSERGAAQLEKHQAEIVIITHEAREGSVKRALEKLARETFMVGPPVLLRIEEAL